MKIKKKRSRNIHISDDMWEKLKKIANKKEIATSQVVRDALMEYLTKSDILERKG